LLKRLNGATMKLITPGGAWSTVPVLHSWTVTDEEVSITFTRGVIETLGRELTRA
jgi:hypothetical protein